MTNDIDNQPAAPAGWLIHNWISLAGIVLAASSLFAVACLIALDFFRSFRNPYVGILTYVVAPAFLVAGLLLISAGALWERHRRHRQPLQGPSTCGVTTVACVQNDPAARRITPGIQT